MAWYMRSVLTAGMPQMTASTARRYIARSARSAAKNRFVAGRLRLDAFGVSISPRLIATGRSFLHLRERLIHGECVRLLHRREVLERLYEFRDDLLRNEDEISVVERPLVVGVRGDVRELVWIRSQV